MGRMIIFIPKSAYHIVPLKVYESIQRQNTPQLNLKVIEVIGDIKKPEKTPSQHTVSARNLYLRIASKMQDSYFMSMDSDKVIVKNGIIEEMLNKMESDNTIAALSLSEKKVSCLFPGHIDLACTLYRTSALDNIEFKCKFPCECGYFTDDLKKTGYKHIYFSKEPLIETIDREVYGTD